LNARPCGRPAKCGSTLSQFGEKRFGSIDFPENRSEPTVAGRHFYGPGHAVEHSVGGPDLNIELELWKRLLIWWNFSEHVAD